MYLIDCFDTVGHILVVLGFLIGLHMSPYVGLVIISYDESAPKIQQKIQAFAWENFFVEY